MHLVINSYGASLSKKDGRFIVHSKDGQADFSPDKIRSISVSRGTKITSDAILLAIAHEVDVIFTDKTGMPEGRVWSHSYGSIATIRKNQLEFVFSPDAVNWIKEILHEKLDNQAALLLSFKTLLDESDQRRINSVINTLEDHKFKILNTTAENVAEAAPSLRGWEGAASRRYFQAVNTILPEEYKFDKRSKMPAQDPFNALLNYGYGMLYGKVEAALIKAGLDPYVGVMHRDNYNRPVLVFDIIELFRIWIDYVVLNLCRQSAFVEECFTEKQGGIWLDGLGKRIIIQSVNEYLDEVVTIKGTSRSRIEQIQLEAHRFAKKLK